MALADNLDNASSRVIHVAGENYAALILSANLQRARDTLRVPSIKRHRPRDDEFADSRRESWR